MCSAPAYTVIPNDWRELEEIINDLAYRIHDESLSSSDYLLKNGTRELTGNWDAGSYSITASKFISDVAVGTSPYACTSTTLNTNLNADLWDGNQFADYLDQAVKVASSPTLAGLTLTGKLGAGSFGSPIDVTNTREYGFELHYSGNNYNATGIRSRVSAVTTDTTAQFQGGLFQAANNDGINVGVLNGLLAEAIGKSDSTAATISMMRAGIFNAEWNSKDTVTDLRTLHVRTHTRNNATEGYISNSGYGIYIENEAVGGNGQALDAGIYFKGTNLSGGNKAFDYGIDFSGATYNTAEIRFSNGETINNLTDGQLDISEDLLVGGDVEATTFSIEETTLSIDEWTYLDGLDQALKTSDSPSHPTITLTNIDNGRIPYSGDGTLYDTSGLTWTPATSTFGTANAQLSGHLRLGTNGRITLPRTNDYGYILGHSGSATANGARGTFYPQNDNSGMTFHIIPKGTAGWSSQALLSLFNTDFVVDSTNYERLYIGAFKTDGYKINVDAAGSNGIALRNLYFQMGGSNALVIDTNVDVDIPNDLTAGTIQADNGYSGSWVNNEGNTVTVVGGVITDVS